jgi:predicted phosphodiesterase
MSPQGAAAAALVEALGGTTRDPLASYDEAWTQFAREIGMAKDRYRGPSKREPDPNGRTVTVLSDLHIPWHDPVILADVIARESKRTDLLVISGDFSDAYSLSRFLLYDWMPFRDEWAQVVATMDHLSAAFPKILLLVGNHDGRLEKQLRSHLTADMVEAVSWMTGGTLCPLTMLAARYPNVAVAQHRLASGRTLDWLTTVGDVCIAHPEVFSVVPTGATRKMEQSLAVKAEEWNVEGCRLIIIGHTHQRSDIPWRDKRLIEPGCLCLTQGYQTTPRIGVTTQRRGYCRFWQDAHGRTDFNTVYVHDYDEWLRLGGGKA